jgi:hypothetical protein
MSYNEYSIILDMYHNRPEEFDSLSEKEKQEFYDILYNRK